MKVTTRRRNVAWRWNLALAATAVVLFWTVAGSGAYLNAPAFKSDEQMIPMRDGVKLHTLIVSPEGLQGRLPILLLRTPYGIDGRASTLGSTFKELADDGYIFVFQDLRGKFKSEGAFVMTRPPRSGRPQVHRRGDRRL